MLKLDSLFFRVPADEWNGCDYFFQLPDTAFESREEAQADIGAHEMVVTWSEMTNRIYSDIHDDA